jgi:hypothetical protein
VPNNWNYSRINPGETIVLVHFGTYALFLLFGDHEIFFWLSRDHVLKPCTLETIEKVLGCLQQFLCFWSRYNSFLCFWSRYNNCSHFTTTSSRGITGLLDMKRLLFAQMGRGKIQWGAFTSGKIQWGAFTITGLLDMKHLLFAQMGRGKIQWGVFTVHKLASLSDARRRRRSAKSARTACPRRWLGSRGGCALRGARARPRCCH